MKELRYGENPHQKAFALIAPDTATMGAGHAEQLWGKELSYNNLLDVDAAFELVRDLSRPAAAVIKHTNPCGAALGRSSADAFSRAYEADSRSAFGGIVAFNSPVDKETAEQIADKKKFLEVLIAPSFEEDALEVLKQGPKWCRNLRILRTGPRLEKGPSTRLQVRSLRGVLLCQEYDDVEDSLEEVVTQRVPDSKERVSLDLAWRIVRHVKSNAIVLVKDGVLVGSGAGQMSRVESVTLAIQRAGVNSEGASMGSDAFFPFPDGIETAARAGVRSVVQPGGSVKDGAVIEAADTADMSMIFTRRRHFRH